MAARWRQDTPEASELHLTLYQVLAARRTAYDQLFWQAPVLSLTAQAFLFTIALSGGATVWARRIAALLALFSALAAIQLMIKQRYLEMLDSKLCAKLERELKIGEILGCGGPHAGIPGRILEPGDAPSGLRDISSFVLWCGLLIIFGLAALFTLALTFTNLLG